MDMEAFLKKADALQQKSCWVFDTMPVRVPPHRGEAYFLFERQLCPGPAILADRTARIAVKLVCYYDFLAAAETLDGWQEIPSENLYAAVYGAYLGSTGWVNLLLAAENALLTVGEGVLALYNPGRHLRELSEQLALSEGLFFRWGMQ